MENIKCKLISESDNEKWYEYFALSQEISKKHYPAGYDAGKTIEKFREQIRKNSVNLSFLKTFLVFENDVPAAWFDLSKVESDLYFGFDVLADVVPKGILNNLYTGIYEELAVNDYGYAVNYVFREPLIKAFKDSGASINEETLISRLEKKDMNESFYKEIATNDKLNKWRLEFYTDIPAEQVDKFEALSQSAINDIASLDPNKAKMYPFTYEGWKKNIENFGSFVTVCLLYDNEDNIAGLTWVLSYPNGLNTVQHNGGLTAVAPNYRGLGIARYLKANLYLKLLNENKDFKYVTTDTMPWNKYMFRINEEFGFKPHRKGCSFKLPIDFLKTYLNK